MAKKIEDDYDFEDISLLRNLKPKRKNSKKKGDNFERSIAKVFNSAFNTTEFVRSPGSGAFATTHKLPDHMKVAGDLITPLNFSFLIECKKGYNSEGIGSIFKSNSNINKFINQARRDSRRENKEFIVCWKQDRGDTLAILEERSFRSLLNPNCGYSGDFIYIGVDSTTNLVIVKLEQLLNNTKNSKKWTNYQ